MMDDLEQMIKERLLQDLIEKMSDSSGDRMKPQGLGVEVQAKDKGSLADGLDKAKELVSAPGSDEERMAAMAGKPSDDSDDSDDEALMKLLGDGEDDEDEKGRG